MTEELLPFCECGECGLRVTKKGNRYINGHNNRGITFSLERCNAMSVANLGKPHTSEAQITADDAQRGVPRPPEACAAISAGKLGVPNPRTSPAQLAAIDMQRGGNDICDHHYIYDHANPELYTMKVTRAKHAQIHNWIRKAGIVVPHINEDVGPWRYATT